MKKIVQKLSQFRKNKKGFTLLETLVAVFILSLALTGPIYIATLAIRSSVETRDNISAYFLAEEAIEAVRNVRDERSFKGPSFGWIGGSLGTSLQSCLNPKGVNTTKCTVNILTDNTYAFVPCDATCAPLTFSAQSPITYGKSIYDDATAIESKFTREMYLEEIQSDKEVVVHVTVRWEDKGRERKFEITERLFNQEYGEYYAER